MYWLLKAVVAMVVVVECALTVSAEAGEGKPKDAYQKCTENDKVPKQLCTLIQFSEVLLTRMDDVNISNGRQQQNISCAPLFNLTHSLRHHRAKKRKGRNNRTKKLKASDSTDQCARLRVFHRLLNQSLKCMKKNKYGGTNVTPAVEDLTSSIKSYQVYLNVSEAVCRKAVRRTGYMCNLPDASRNCTNNEDLSLEDLKITADRLKNYVKKLQKKMKRKNKGKGKRGKGDKTKGRKKLKCRKMKNKSGGKYKKCIKRRNRRKNRARITNTTAPTETTS